MSAPILQGMTGFARIEGGHAAWRWAIEAKSVNGRGLDVKFRAPAAQEGLEPLVREAATARFKRGSLQIALSVRREAGPAASAARLDMAFLQAVIEAGEPFVLKGLVQQARWDGLLALRGAFLAEEESAPDPEALGALNSALIAAIGEALDGLATARAREGAALNTILTTMLDEIAGLTTMARALAAAAPAALAKKLHARLADLTGAAGIDPQRLAQEVALLAAKADVREELDRLEAHISDARALLAGRVGVGRKLDFLIQEFNREANTLCSKATDTALTRIGLGLKTAVDQLREQAANVE
jgi:uncharacterized protein (TIGR00255 family)